MDWQALWDKNALKNDQNAQVSRLSKEVVSEEKLEQIASYIAQQINLQADDRLLDVCCGNGTITIKFSNFCNSITGLDFSKRQIKNAKERQDSGIDFIHGDALKLDEFVDGLFDKIVCHFSFQYFDSYKKGFSALVKMKKVLAPGGYIFLGDIPDYNKKNSFFPLWIPRLRHEARRLLKREPMGKFWKKNTLDKMAKILNLEGQVITQSEDMLYSHYRFDYLLNKPLQ